MKPNKPPSLLQTKKESHTRTLLGIKNEEKNKKKMKPNKCCEASFKASFKPFEVSAFEKENEGGFEGFEGEKSFEAFETEAEGLR